MDSLDEGTLHEGMLRCMRNAGHLDMALNHVDGLCASNPEVGHKLLPHAVEAAWRLCQWDALDKLLHRCGLETGAPTCPAATDTAATGAAGSGVGPTPPPSLLSAFTAPSARLRLQHAWQPAGLGDAGRVAPQGSSPLPFGLVHHPTSALMQRCPPEPPAALGASTTTPNAAQDAAALFRTALGAAMLAVRRRDEVAGKRALSMARDCLLEPLSAASMESYRRAYPFLVRLHILHELEQGLTLASMGADEQSGAPMMWHWPRRFQLMQPALGVREPLLAARRVLFNLQGLHRHEADCYVQSIKDARSTRFLQSASSSLLHLMQLNDERAPLVAAKLRMDEGDLYRAQQYLERGELTVEQVRGQMKYLPTKRKQLLAKKLLLATELAQATGLRQGHEIASRYQLVTELYPTWEKAYFMLGRYYDFLLQRLMGDTRAAAFGPVARFGPAGLGAASAAAGESNDAADGAQAGSQDGALNECMARGKYVLQVVKHYGESLRHGVRNLYQSLPRILTLWLDYTAELVALVKALSDGGRNAEAKVCGRGSRLRCHASSPFFAAAGAEQESYAAAHRAAGPAPHAAG